jgi:hypothetical protein
MDVSISLGFDWRSFNIIEIYNRSKSAFNMKCKNKHLFQTVLRMCNKISCKLFPKTDRRYDQFLTNHSVPINEVKVTRSLTNNEENEGKRITFDGLGKLNYLKEEVTEQVDAPFDIVEKPRFFDMPEIESSIKREFKVPKGSLVSKCYETEVKKIHL